VAKKCGLLLKFSKTAHRKQSPKRRKFTLSGHPASHLLSKHLLHVLIWTLMRWRMSNTYTHSLFFSLSVYVYLSFSLSYSLSLCMSISLVSLYFLNYALRSFLSHRRVCSDVGGYEIEQERTKKSKLLSLSLSLSLSLLCSGCLCV
jgi:hypothetical protein